VAGGAFVVVGVGLALACCAVIAALPRLVHPEVDSES